MNVVRSRWIAVFFLLIGCDSGGDQQDRGSAGASADLRDDLALGELSASQRQALCEMLEEAEEPIVDAFDAELCTWQAQIAETLGAESCEDFRSSCLADEDDEGEEAEGDEEEFDDCPVTTRTTCRNVTVKELKDCNDALLARDKRAGERIRELALTCDDELPDELEIQVPTSCQRLIDRCPSLEIEREVD